MKTLNLADNPFKVFTPEGMDAEDTIALFVQVPDFNKIRDPGHTMLNGPRGCGKSMIFRYLLPDCQCLHSSTSLDQLPFYAVHVSIKNTSPNLTEFHRLDDQNAKIILNEHVLTLFVAAKVFDSLKRTVKDDKKESGLAALGFFHTTFIRRLKECGWRGSVTIADNATAPVIFSKCEEVCDSVYRQINDYAKRLSFPGQEFSYGDALCDYTGFLYPILRELSDLPFMPNGPFYLLMDDADNLSHTQTRVLNSWVATRTQQEVSIKISTQLRYKTFAAVSGDSIQTPHDYQEINIADKYTSRRSKYPQRIEEILKRRLEKANIKVSPKDFFPPDEKQELDIATIGKKLHSDYSTSGRGFRPSDDVTRYARPEYFKSLGGTSKQSSSYSYAGFDQLVHISSGLIRYFLEPAAQMFDEELSLSGEKPITFIRPSVQDDIIRREAENLMFNEFDKIARDQEIAEQPDRIGSDLHQLRTEKLRNLIKALGGTFHEKLISNDSERRVFSVAISGIPDPEIVEIFEMGVRYGYFHRSSIGNKDGTGRTRLYVLTRRLAPHFNLDPSSFAGYLWVTNDLLREGIANPEKALRKIKKDGVSAFETAQLPLFD